MKNNFKKINFHFSNFIDIFLNGIIFQFIGITFDLNFIVKITRSDKKICSNPALFLDQK